MRDLIDYLFDYVQEQRVASCLYSDPEYRLAGRRMDETEAWLEANLPPEAREQLERLTAARAEWSFRCERALFRCGLSLGLELGALNRFPG